MIRYLDLTADTICAPITGAGRAAVSTIRVSGSKAREVVNACLKRSIQWESHRVYLRDFVDSDQVIDQVVLTFFAQGKSFTGDETIEISCHGNPLILQKIVRGLTERGCRMAEPGEFAFRAFYNGKIDLPQAEAINQMIMSTNAQANSQYVQMLSGQLSTRIYSLEAALVGYLAELEASIDFSEEDIPDVSFKGLRLAAQSTMKELTELLATFSLGRTLDRGAKILLSGKTNVGKSSLFNLLCGEERAIVTASPGTTRDVLRAQVFLNSIPVEILDTAGLRESYDEIEQLGIQRGLKEIDLAERILLVMDAQHHQSLEINSYPKEKIFFVFNKVDALDPLSLKSAQSQANELVRTHGLRQDRIFWVSAKTGAGIPQLIDAIESSLVGESQSSDNVLLTQARHFNHLRRAQAAFQNALVLLDQGESPDLISQELQVALMEIQGLLGKTYDDEILDRIFSQFCIGK